MTVCFPHHNTVCRGEKLTGDDSSQNYDSVATDELPTSFLPGSQLTHTPSTASTGISHAHKQKRKSAWDVKLGLHFSFSMCCDSEDYAIMHFFAQLQRV